MATLKSDKKLIEQCFQVEIIDGWFLDINTNVVPTTYTLTHGKKSMSFHSDVARELCQRDYSLRLARGRKQMVLPPHVLQAFVEYETFIMFIQSSADVASSERANVVRTDVPSENVVRTDVPSVNISADVMT